MNILAISSFHKILPIDVHVLGRNLGALVAASCMGWPRCIWNGQPYSWWGKLHFAFWRVGKSLFLLGRAWQICEQFPSTRILSPYTRMPMLCPATSFVIKVVTNNLLPQTTTGSREGHNVRVVQWAHETMMMMDSRMNQICVDLWLMGSTQFKNQTVTSGLASILQYFFKVDSGAIMFVITESLLQETDIGPADGMHIICSL